MLSNPEQRHNTDSREREEHSILKHFPTEEEVLRLLAAQGVAPLPSLDEIEFRLGRQLARILAAGPGGNGVRDLFAESFTIASALAPWLQGLMTAQLRPRFDHRWLDAAARNKFNEALQEAYGDGGYQKLAADHNMNGMMLHRMHGVDTEGNFDPVGQQRFLPWHRIYVLEMENLLRSKRPSVTIPYWNYAEDRARPDWVWQPPGVVRNVPGENPDAPGSLPSKATVDNLINNASTYTTFTSGIENNAHNDVHQWCNGTITHRPTAAEDPIFWLLHANVDRMWDAWQLRHSGTPALSGKNATMDPWVYTATDANSVIELGYVYVGAIAIGAGSFRSELELDRPAI
jgi:hypothetical protein